MLVSKGFPLLRATMLAPITQVGDYGPSSQCPAHRGNNVFIGKAVKTIALYAFIP